MQRRGQQRSYGSKAMTRKAAEQALASLLLNARDEAFARFTAEGLAGSYRVPVPRVAQMLEAERRRRG